MNLETLYKRTKTSAIQFWEASVIAEGDSVRIVKTSGKLGTDKPLVHREPISAGKNLGKTNATTPIQQAESQASSDWNKKRDEGYKSLSDLSISQHPMGGKTQYLTKDQQFDSLSEALQAILPQFNTDASGNIKPMRAPTKPWKPGQKISYPQRLETKFDGVRATLVITENLDEIQFLSRSGKEYTTLSHLKEAIQTAIIERKFIIQEYPIILDGEIYCHGMTLEEINQAVKRYRAETLQLEYWVFDLPLHTGSQAERSRDVVFLVEDIDSPLVKAVEGVIVKSDEEVKHHHDTWAQLGYEGAMLKDLKGVYEQGHRSSYWRKVKEFDDTEFEIIDYKLGQRGVEDLLFVCQCPDGEFEVKMSGTTASKQDLFNQAEQGKIVGKHLTVKHFGYTKYGIPNLPTGKALREKE